MWQTWWLEEEEAAAVQEERRSCKLGRRASRREWMWKDRLTELVRGDGD